MERRYNSIILELLVLPLFSVCRKKISYMDVQEIIIRLLEFNIEFTFKD